MNSDSLFISNPALAAELTAALNNAEHTAVNPAVYEQALIDAVADRNQPHALPSPEEADALANAMGGTIDQSEALAILVLQQQENSSQPRPAVDIIPRTVDSFITADPLLEPALCMQQ